LSVESQFCTVIYDKRTRVQEAEKSPWVEAVARKWLVEIVIV
jgi:hypothetical protein